ncbi:DUF2510 domain-containing protein [Planobispora longispora]|nr:DUF2510 domain-containing protein [Planobispora longispora]
MTTQTPAGWYPDPYGSPQLRWWDGNQWTDATHPAEAAAGQAPGPQPDRSFPPQSTGPHAASAPPQAGTPPRPEQPQWGGAPGDTAQLPTPGYAPPDGGFASPGGPQQSGPQQDGPQQSGAFPGPGGPQHSGPFPGPGGPQQAGAFPGPGGPQHSGPFAGPHAHHQGGAFAGGPQQAGAFPGPGGPHQGGPFPGGPQQAGPFPGPGGPHQGGAFPGPGGPQPGGKSPLPWILGGVGAVILVVAIVFGAMYLLDTDRNPTASGSTSAPTATAQQPTAEPTPTPTPTPSPTAAPPSAGPLPQPKDGRVEDPVTGLSYDYPGDEWIVPTDNGNNPLGIVWTSGILAMSHENYDGQGSNWLGNVFTAELPEEAGYSGPASAKVAAEAVLNALEPTFYSPKHTKKIVESKAVKVSGKDAWQLSVELDFTGISKASGWKWKKERATFVIVDRGADKRPGLVYISIPDNLDSSLTDRVLTSLKLS